MPNKAYAILYSDDHDHEDIGHFYFPIKRAGAEYCENMPQFFGGTKDGDETDLQTIAREAGEESNSQVTITALGPCIYTYIEGDDEEEEEEEDEEEQIEYKFYIVTQFTGHHFVGPLPGNDEMKSIEHYPVHAGGEDDIGHFFDHLGIGMSHEFAESETCSAFEAALAWGQEEST